MTEIRLDLLGEVCPIPLLKVKKKLNELTSEQKLIIITDHTQAVRNIMNLLEKKNYDFEVEDVEVGLWEIEVYN
ncbi:sulfurtransferase TusA family protein [Natroniella sulfidigena]|uniref:sulfurtransferase TusA family protein n=1 Tax=Natroniella sulfidigena TaxID=723921 RepID=UPI00200A1930|nr:sulfurtransferase TusA family protein [Natroniella sulfidigena]MCK8816098.1 sulfurtransferase TusA family protein [Natroniella sulfidigena]